jgi:hypothetical protein
MERGKEGKRESRKGRKDGRATENERTGRRKDGKTKGREDGRHGKAEGRRDGETEERKDRGKMESGERTEGLREMMKGLANRRIGRRSRRRLSGDRGCRFVLLLY